MLEALAYLPTLALFSLVIVSSARMRHELLLLVCIPPVFVAAIVGFVMLLYAIATFGVVPSGAAVLAGASPAWWLARRLNPGELLVTIYLAWALASVLALIAFNFPDQPG